MRSLPFLAALALLPLLPGLAAPAEAAVCSARSTPQRATLIELYTSEGCSSCPPAEHWLSGFAPGGGNIVPLAFHVDYWDQLGWRDPYAAPAYTARQYEKMRIGHGRFVYTPQVLVGGRDASDWRRAAPGQLPRGEAQAAGAEIRLNADTRGGLLVRLDAELGAAARAGQKPAMAYLALYENGLVSEVRAGENAGQQLRHDFVVREWLGPYAFDAAGRLSVERRIERPDVAAGRTGLAALVETEDGSVLQALALPLCP